MHTLAATVAALPMQSIDTTIPSGFPYFRLLGLLVLTVAFVIVGSALYLTRHQRTGDTTKAFDSGKISGMQMFLVILGLSCVALVTLGQEILADLLGISG